MNLKLFNGELSLPKDFRFDIATNHPFFSNEGSSSTPTTLPSTPGNRALLNGPDNMNAANRYNRHMRAILSHGVYSKPCRLIVDSASHTGGVTASLALEESEMYAEHQDKKLGDILTILNFHVEISNDAKQMADYYYKTDQNDFVFLKVAADAEDSNNADTTGSTRRASVVLNETATSGGNIVMKTTGYTIKRDNGNGGKSTISLPKYYGLAPYIKLRSVIRKVFVALGYTVKYSAFDTSPLSRIVLLHNTADALTSSYFDDRYGVRYFQVAGRDILPSITLGDFIEWLRDKFGAFVSIRNNEVSIRLLKDILAAPYDYDLSDYLRDEATVQHPDPVMLRIGCQQEIEGSEPAAETLEALRAAYPTLVTCYSVAQAEGVGLFHIMPLGKFYFRNQASDNIVKVGTDGFDCYREMGVETEEIKSDDVLVPMILHNDEYIPYIGETVRRHVDIDDKDAEADQKIMVCYCRNTNSRNFGTLYNYSPSGAQLSTTYPDLIPEALTTAYWESYRRLKLDSAPTISAKLDIPLHILATMDICTPKLFCGAKVLIQSMKYSITNDGVSTCDFTFLRIQKAADGEEITDPVFGSNLIWERVSTRRTFTNVTGSGNKRNGYEVTGTDGLPDYTNADAPSYTPQHPGIIEKKRTRKLYYTYYHWESGGWFLWYWCSYGSNNGSETYYEYFISKNR